MSPVDNSSRSWPARPRSFAGRPMAARCGSKPPSNRARTLDDPTRAWDRFAARVEVHEVPGDRFHFVTGVREHHGTVHMGSLVGDAVGVFDL